MIIIVIIFIIIISFGLFYMFQREKGFAILVSCLLVNNISFVTVYVYAYAIS